MKRKVTVATAIVIVLVGLTMLASRQHTPASYKLPVTATFYPLAEFARKIGGDKVQVATLVQPGTEPHDYDPSPQDVAGMYRSKVFIYNGADLERWVDRVQNDLAKNKVTIVQASSGVMLRGADSSEADSSAASDPHVWMDPVLAIKEVQNIEAGFIKADPANETTYANNTAAYIAQLQSLDRVFRAGLAGCQIHTIVTSHQAFSYLGAEYNFTAVGIAGLSPDDEPSPQKLAQVADIVRRNNVRYIFFEDLVSSKLSDTIAQETGVQTIAFNPLEGLTSPEIKEDKDYISVQKDNLQALRTALNCK